MSGSNVNPNKVPVFFKHKEQKHAEKSRHKEYRSGDFYLYLIECVCGDVSDGWTPQECEEQFKKHLKKEGK